jgi:hypothetical protein
MQLDMEIEQIYLRVIYDLFKSTVTNMVMVWNLELYFTHLALTKPVLRK